jgi:predicted RNA-binding protein YlxR (DUF448 family)
VAKKTAKRVKHVPQRTCVGCRQILAKRSLIRIVRTPEGLRVDPTGKIPGRGAYLHDRRECWESGLKGALAHALKVELTDQDRETLRAFMATLPEDALPREAALPTEAVQSSEKPISQKAHPLGVESSVKQVAETNRAENIRGKHHDTLIK